MKRSILPLLVLALGLVPAGAVEITLNGLSNTDWASPSDNPSDPTRRNNAVITQDSVVVGDRAGAPVVGDGSNTATLDVSDFLEDGEGEPSAATLAYTVGGLDLDGTGGFNDSFVLSFTVTASSGGIGTPGFAVDDVPNDEPLNQGYLNLDTGGNINASDEFINIQFSSLVVNLNGGTGNGSGTFDGFSGVHLLNLTGTSVPKINGVNTAAGVADVDLAPGGLDSGLLMEWGGTGRYYAGTWDVQVTIPAAPGQVTLADFTYDPADGSAEVSIVGAANTNYKLVEADDLDFSNPDQDPIPLTGASVGTLDGNEVTTDGSGNATVQFNLGTAKAATFLRAETAP
ncbi:hypothetical protein [Haloferula sp. A504]|uniref:hypothetical protein n=1 Tax=Haloferula sp. A504 TaxID=3373601 RepID=UPI0031BFCF6F|nr:hypothetical protein [Verrucomicrobiaceae bacterium E54]